MKPLPDRQTEGAAIKIAVAGALGRMGNVVSDAVAADPGLELVARFDRPELAGDSLMSQDAALAVADVVIDFTTPAADVGGKPGQKRMAGLFIGEYQ